MFECHISAAIWETFIMKLVIYVKKCTGKFTWDVDYTKNTLSSHFFLIQATFFQQKKTKNCFSQSSQWCSKNQYL